MKNSIIILLILLSFDLFSQEWSDDVVGIDSLWNFTGEGGCGNIYDMLNNGDSILYIGGSFYYVNQVFVNDFLSWNTQEIKIYQEGFNYGQIKAITIYNNKILVGGAFQNASNEPNTSFLAEWNGYTRWQAFNGGGILGEIKDLLVYNDTLYICGNFNEIGSSTYDMVAGYYNGHWINMGTWGQWVSSLEILNGELYGGGYYGLRRYIGEGEWEIFPEQPNGNVYELKTDTINTLLYVCGGFNHIGESTSYGAAIWDGFNWGYTGEYCSTTLWPQSTAIYRGDLFTGCGRYYENEDQYRTFITRWNGTTWDSIGGAFNDNIFAIEVFRDTLYIGGGFTHWGGDSPNPTHRSKGLVKLYMPDNGCDYLKPRINTWADTFYLEGGEVDVNLYNNNPYVDSWEWDFDDGGVSTSSTTAVEHTYSEVGEYNVQVTVTDGECVKTANKTIYIELGNEIPQFEQIDMHIFPNPSSNDFTVKVTLPNYQNAEIKIAGLNGHLKTVIPVTGETTIIPTKGWKAGVYVCNLFINGNLVRTEKLVFK